MQITFYTNFSKKKNSTKQPTTGTGIPTRAYNVTGHLKEPCSILNPIISFQGNPLSPSAISSTHYAYISDFSRYYFVKDWVWNDGLWDVHLEVDVLASWRTQIGNQSMYILRADTRNTQAVYVWNPAITDTLYPATTNFHVDHTPMSSPFETSVNSGVYVVGIIGSDDTNAVGAITYYAMTSSQFGNLKETLFGIDGLEVMGLVDSSTHEWTATDMGEQIFKTMYNPFQYIVSCNWFPIAPAYISGTTVTQLKIGWWVYGVTAKRMSQQTGTFYDGTIELPPHPQASTRGTYLNFAPYTKRTLYGKFGSIPIDTAFFDLDESATTYYKYMIGKYTVDYVTGQCLYQLYTARSTNSQTITEQHLIHKTEFLLGVPIQLAQIGMDYLGTVSTALSSVTGTISSTLTGASALGIVGGITGAIGGVSNGIYDTIQTAMPQMETSGSNGSFINMAISTELVSIYYAIVYEDEEHKGRPVCVPHTINMLNGYVLCADGDFDIDCMDDERDTIRAYLTSGFFWE